MEIIYKWLYAHPDVTLTFYIERHLKGHNLTFKMHLTELNDSATSMISIDNLYLIKDPDSAIKAALDNMYFNIINHNFGIVDGLLREIK